ncbi:MAG: WYL domain-containing protein [Ignavibacteriae bacterium]|nr:WYL domain-containing protein [Ignavibacteriota bacterium]
MKAVNKVILSRLSFIDNSIQKNKYVKTTELAREYEVSEKTIYRDIQYMKDYFDAPIEYDSNRKSYHYTKPFRLNAFDFTITELYNLAVIRELIRSNKYNPYKTGQKSLFNKLFQSFGDEILNEVRKVKEKVSFNFKPVRKLDEKLFKAIEDALFNERTIKIEYFMVDKNESNKRTIDPYHLRNYEGDWYLIGYNHEKKKVRIMAVNRILKVKKTDFDFDIPDTFKVKDYFKDSFRKRRTSKIYDINLEIKKQYAAQLLESEIHSSQKLKNLPNGNIRVTFKVNDLLEIKEWILTKEAKVIVKSPPELIKMVKKDAEAILKSYK